MATIATIGISVVPGSVCSANNHALVALDLNSGEKTRELKAEIKNLITSAIDDDDLEGFLKILLKLGGRGKTRAQLKAALEAGVTVTISI